VRVYEQTPVTGWEGRVLQTPGGAVRAGAVLRTTEGYSEGLPGNARRLLAFTSQIVATEPLSAEVWSEIGMEETKCLTTNDRLFIYMQRTVDDRIALGGRYTYRPARPTALDAEPRFLVQRNFELLESAVAALFPAAAAARITHRWGGIWGATRDFCPVVSFDARTRTGWAGGYGDGVGASNLAGRTLADLVLGRDTDLAHSGWVNHHAGAWPREPVTRAATWAISNAFRTADERELRGDAAPRWVGLFERLVPK
jgi:glycine/D-amino acid oxidase-like deaminating enzyme